MVRGDCALGGDEVSVLSVAATEQRQQRYRRNGERMTNIEYCYTFRGWRSLANRFIRFFPSHTRVSSNIFHSFFFVLIQAFFTIFFFFFFFFTLYSFVVFVDLVVMCTQCSFLFLLLSIEFFLSKQLIIRKFIGVIGARILFFFSFFFLSKCVCVLCSWYFVFFNGHFFPSVCVFR